MSAAGASRGRSGQKPRFLAAAYGVMSDEVAKGNFIQIKDRRRIETRVLESPAP